jgi:hypothetical protein
MAGDHPDGWLVESDKPLPRSVFPGALYVRTPEGDLHVANPFFRIREVRSGVSTVAVLTKIEDEGPRYRSLTERESWIEPSAIGQVSRTLG